MDKEAAFLESIVKELVEHPDKLEITQELDNQGIKLTLRADSADIGKIIGHKGATAQALRLIMRAYGGRNDSRIGLLIEEPDKV